MKQRFKKLLACMLAATLCIPAFPTIPAQAAKTNDIFWTEEETVPVSIISETERSVNFNESWKFGLGDSSTAYQKDFNDSDWSMVSLPHDFSIFQDFTGSGEAESGFLPGGIGWYRKLFSLPESFSGKSIVLNFDGAYKDTTVYVNGEKIGENHYGYTPFAFDISQNLICDGKTENLVAVRVENKLPSSRWYSGSGIFRDVTLIITNPVHIPLNGTYVTTPKLAASSGKDGTVNIDVNVQNDGDSSASVDVRHTVYEKDGTKASEPVTSTITIPAGETADASSEANVPNPKLWSPESPSLYYVKTEILQGNTVLDSYDTEFGFKWYEFVDNVGFRLNGKNVKINGVCMHHDQGALGSAAYHDAIYRQMSVMKDMGVNTIRVTHNPAADILLDACNELGLMVIEEAFDGWGIPKNGNSNDFSVYFDRNLTDDNQIIGGNSSMTWAEFALKAMIKRGRNNASVILWSLGNEIQEGTNGNYNWGQAADKLIAWAKEVDDSHPLTSGSNNRSTGDTGVSAVNLKIYQNGGVPGFNYGDLGAMSALHGKYPVFLWSETVSPNNSRSIYTTQISQANADGKYHLTSYDTSRVGWGQTCHYSMYSTLTNDWLAGECVWTGFDYIGEPTPWNGTGTGDNGRGAIPNSSYFGIVETTGFPKDNFYLYRSQWNQKENTLHLVTAWDSNNMINNSGKTPVWVYSNAAKVELYRDGELVGTATRKDTASTTTAAGHTHYEYTTQSNSQQLCSTASGSADASLYSVFDVAFAAGTISAKAYDENGKDITASCSGSHSITTPAKASKLVAYADKESIDADGSSLSYITIDVTDANGNLKTTAGNEISVKLTGQGEIVGVDNGDQATTRKYQQSSVLENGTSANIDAFSGKALVIVRSTKQTGKFTIQAESKGLEGASVTVTTKATATGEAQLAFYNLSKHCYVPTGSKDIDLPATIDAGFTDGSTKQLSVKWNDYDKSQLMERGNFQITGSFVYGGQTINLSLTAHVHDPIGGVQGFSYHTEPRKAPSLPATAMVYYTSGEAFEEYPVTWDMSAITADSLVEANTVVSVPGTMDVLGKRYNTTATIRVAEGEDPTQANVATARDHLVDNGPYNDTLTSITDGKRNDDGNSSSRWTTWDHRNIGQVFDDITITMDWATATMTDQINLLFFKQTSSAASVLPSSVKFEYALSSNYDSETREITANEWIEIEYSEPTSISDFTDNDWTTGKSYKLKEKINPQAIRITFAHPANTFIGLNEVEVIGTTYSYYPKSSAALTSVTYEGKTVDLEAGGSYTLDAGLISQLAFNNPNNASLTFIQDQSSYDTLRVVARSEDGSDTQEYFLKLTDIPKQETLENLQGKLADYKALDEILYTIESFKVLQDTVNSIEKVIDTLPESQLQKKLTELNTAYDSLVSDVPTDATRTSLNSKLTSYKNLDSKLYTIDSYEAFQKAVKAIEQQISAIRRESELKKKINELDSAYSKLISDAPTDATLNNLKNKLAEYKALDSKLYTADSFTALQNTITAIEGQMNSLRESELKQKLTELEASFNKLVKVETPPEEKPANPLKKGTSAKIDSIEYRVLDPNKKTAAAVKFTKKKATVTIKDTVTIKGVSCKVVHISANAFKNNKTLKNLSIGKNVTTIGKNAFYGCSKLSKVIFKGANVNSFGKNAFKKTSSKINVKVPKSVKKSKFKTKLTKAGMNKKVKIK